MIKNANSFRFSLAKSVTVLCAKKLRLEKSLLIKTSIDSRIFLVLYEENGRILQVKSKILFENALILRGVSMSVYILFNQ